MWLLLVRPQRKRSNEQMSMQDSLQTGDEIITAGGLHATVRSIEDDVLEIELAPSTIVRLDRRAVAAVVHPDSLEPESVAEESFPADDG
ncbi:MAG: preprotein translocase subunit YajC [Actinobacteria bacterium]|nr:MAG: preprotein translocase subunit YajC [Actinomycetota bacterium]